MTNNAVLREIIEIDQALCDGCGECIPACQEGALQIIDGKARLISELMCDGLGACTGHCPTGAMQVLKREAAPYDERQVMMNIIAGGANVIKAHLEHLLAHQEMGYYQQALDILAEQNIAQPKLENLNEQARSCPGSQESSQEPKTELRLEAQPSQLSTWPIQLHLVNPGSPQFAGAELLLAADCTAFAAGDFHERYLKGKKLLIACPKLDGNQEIYIEKLKMILFYGQVKSLTILRMEVPCCGGLSQLIRTAMFKAPKQIPVEEITINNTGEVVAQTNQ